VIHAHVDATLFEFVNHLIESLGTDVWSHSPIYPGNVVIALIWRPMVVVRANGVFFECLLDVSGHLIELATKVALLVARLRVFQRASELAGKVRSAAKPQEERLPA
jgi:hypothetical protein